MIKVNCKEGVWFKFITFEFLWCAQAVFNIYQKYEVVPTVTSACDGNHAQSSWHYKGLAWDWRIWGITDPHRAAEELREDLGRISAKYKVIFGDPQHLDHIHTEYQP
jgi:hypothetical protein